MAYIGYNTGARMAPTKALPSKTHAKLAWGRLAAVAASLMAWVGIVAAIRAIF